MVNRATPLDLALAEHPSAEADSRAVAAAAIPPLWAQVDVAARHFQRLLDDARVKMGERAIQPPTTQRGEEMPRAG
jgi:hypothetical protein